MGGADYSSTKKGFFTLTPVNVFVLLMILHLQPKEMEFKLKTAFLHDFFSCTSATSLYPHIASLASYVQSISLIQRALNNYIILTKKKKDISVKSLIGRHPTFIFLLS